jgi:hypothetical protein
MQHPFPLPAARRFMGMLAWCFGLFLAVVAPAHVQASGGTTMAENEKVTEITLSVGEKTTLKSGLTIEYVGNDSKTNSISSATISSPAYFLSIYKLGLTKGDVRKEAQISYSDGGWSYTDNVTFEGYKITYVNMRYAHPKYFLTLKIETP